MGTLSVQGTSPGTALRHGRKDPFRFVLESMGPSPGRCRKPTPGARAAGFGARAWVASRRHQVKHWGSPCVSESQLLSRGNQVPVARCCLYTSFLPFYLKIHTRKEFHVLLCIPTCTYTRTRMPFFFLGLFLCASAAEVWDPYQSTLVCSPNTGNIILLPGFLSPPV